MSTQPYAGAAVNSVVVDTDRRTVAVVGTTVTSTLATSNSKDDTYFVDNNDDCNNNNNNNNNNKNKYFDNDSKISKPCCFFLPSSLPQSSSMPTTVSVRPCSVVAQFTSFPSATVVSQHKNSSRTFVSLATENKTNTSPNIFMSANNLPSTAIIKESSSAENQTNAKDGIYFADSKESPTSHHTSTSAELQSSEFATPKTADIALGARLSKFSCQELASNPQATNNLTDKQQCFYNNTGNGSNNFFYSGSNNENVDNSTKRFDSLKTVCITHNGSPIQQRQESIGRSHSFSSSGTIVIGSSFNASGLPSTITVNPRNDVARPIATIPTTSSAIIMDQSVTVMSSSNKGNRISIINNQSSSISSAKPFSKIEPTKKTSSNIKTKVLDNRLCRRHPTPDATNQHLKQRHIIYSGKSMDYCFACGAPCAGFDQTYLRSLFQRGFQSSVSGDFAANLPPPPPPSSQMFVLPRDLKPCDIMNFSAINETIMKQQMSPILLPTAPDAIASFKAACRRHDTQRAYRRNTYWSSFEKYTDYNYSTPLSREISRSGSLCNSWKKPDFERQIRAISEEKCNGDVRFEIAEPESILVNSGDETTACADSIQDGVKIVGKTGPSAHFSTSLESDTRKTTISHRQIRRRQSGYGISITSESTAKMRCKMRKMYFLKRNKVCDFSLLLGLVGLILVVIDSELTALKIIAKSDVSSWLLRGSCVASTVLLVWTLIDYHRIEVKIALIDSGADDWRVAVTTERIIKLSIEIAVCAVCPFPGSGSISWLNISANSMVQVPLDVMLSVPMFLRSYLLCRFMVLHSKQFQDAATRSIAALNRISMDFRFVIKTMMADHPLTVLVIFTVTYWICMSWMFTQCERYNNNYTTEHCYMNSLWFIMVTFMSIGYGDVVPNSYCGRLLSITTGIVGAGVSSALIAVISRKLELSRAEKHVNNFMADSKLTNQRKNAAASVLQHTWFIHKYQKSGHKEDELKLRHHQRKFLGAINDFRRIKWDQRKLQEKGNSLLDVGKLHNEMHETLWEMHRTQDQFIAQIDLLTQRIVELQAAVLTGQVPAVYNAQLQQSFLQPNASSVPLNNISFMASPLTETQKHLVVPQQQRQQQFQQNFNDQIHQQQQEQHEQPLLSVVVPVNTPTNNNNCNVKEYQQQLVRKSTPQSTLLINPNLTMKQQQQEENGSALMSNQRSSEQLTKGETKWGADNKEDPFVISLSNSLSLAAAAHDQTPDQCSVETINLTMRPLHSQSPKTPIQSPDAVDYDSKVEEDCISSSAPLISRDSNAPY